MNTFSAAVRWVVNFLSRVVVAPLALVGAMALPFVASADDGGGMLDAGCAVSDAGCAVTDAGAVGGDDLVGPNGFKVDDAIDPMNLLDLMEKAVTTRNYSMGAGVLLLVAVYMVRKRWSEIPPDMIPAVTLALASLPALALVLMRPQVNATMVWKQMVMIVLMAGGAWSAIGKRVLTVWAPKIASAIHPAPTAPTAPTASPVPVSEEKK